MMLLWWSFFKNCKLVFAMKCLREEADRKGLELGCDFWQTSNPETLKSLGWR